MRVISFRDLKLIPELSKYKEIELLSLEMDGLMEDILSKLGVDTDYPVVYIPSNHRDMQNKVGVGYRAVGELQCNRKAIELYTLPERIAVTAYSDPSLTKELCSLHNSSLDYNAFNDGSEEAPVKATDIQQYVNLDMEQEIVKQLKQLEEIRFHIRGSIYNPDGSLKTFQDYVTPKEALVKRNKKKKHKQ